MVLEAIQNSGSLTRQLYNITSTSATSAAGNQAPEWESNRAAKAEFSSLTGIWRGPSHLIMVGCWIASLCSAHFRAALRSSSPTGVPSLLRASSSFLWSLRKMNRFHDEAQQLLLSPILSQILLLKDIIAIFPLWFLLQHKQQLPFLSEFATRSRVSALPTSTTQPEWRCLTIF